MGFRLPLLLITSSSLEIAVFNCSFSPPNERSSPSEICSFLYVWLVFWKGLKPWSFFLCSLADNGFEAFAVSAKLDFDPIRLLLDPSHLSSLIFFYFTFVCEEFLLTFSFLFYTAFLLSFYLLSVFFFWDSSLFLRFNLMLDSSVAFGWWSVIIWDGDLFRLIIADLLLFPKLDPFFILPLCLILFSFSSAKCRSGEGESDYFLPTVCFFPEDLIMVLFFDFSFPAIYKFYSLGFKQLLLLLHFFLFIILISSFPFYLLLELRLC